MVQFSLVQQQDLMTTKLFNVNNRVKCMCKVAPIQFPLVQQQNLMSTFDNSWNDYAKLHQHTFPLVQGKT